MWVVVESPRPCISRLKAGQWFTHPKGTLGCGRAYMSLGGVYQIRAEGWPQPRSANAIRDDGQFEFLTDLVDLIPFDLPDKITV